ncbi:hypothetical protein AAG570_011248 [Ranatra chinensis]|uniref:Methyltransferase type 11 domain-containing protein n=1 Tax=Ranatra chinensis TaxID=642074 RepID=A0ABD0YKB7_9HEMI
MGYRVTGIDPSEELVSVGKKHAELVKGSYGELKLDYDATSIEQLAEEMPGKYDAVVASEVVEHVTDPESFIQGCVKSLKPGGSLFISTINRTFLSWFVFIFLFEYIFNVIPLGTHLWSKFITPKEIEDQLKEGKANIG